MRLTLIITGLTRGGAERVLSVLANAWSERGHSVTLLTLDTGEAPAYPLHPRVKLEGLGVQAVSENVVQAMWRNGRRVRVLRRAIRDSRPDLVISFMDTVNVLTIVASAGLGTPVIISERTDPSLYRIRMPWPALRRWLYRYADALVCPTQATVERFRAIGPARAVAIANPIDVPARSPGDKRQQAGSDHRLIGMGRLVPQKGFDLLLSAFAKIASRHPDWGVTIYGEGPLLDELQEQARSLGIGERVHFPGTVSDPYSRFQSSDLFVFSSRFEGFGMALAEAMACGLPVVSFDCPEGPGQIIRNDIDGILVPAQNVDALTEAIDRLMGDDAERCRLAQRAPEVRERFSADKAVAGWQALFEDLVGHPSPPTAGGPGTPGDNPSPRKPRGAASQLAKTGQAGSSGPGSPDDHPRTPKPSLPGTPAAQNHSSAKLARTSPLE